MTPEGLEPETKLMEAIDKITPPTSVTEARSFLGLVGYYRRFIKRFSDKAAPLNALLHKEKEWSWSLQCQEAFDLLKGEISRNPFLPIRILINPSGFTLMPPILD